MASEKKWFQVSGSFLASEKCCAAACLGLAWILENGRHSPHLNSCRTPVFVLVVMSINRARIYATKGINSATQKKPLWRFSSKNLVFALQTTEVRAGIARERQGQWPYKLVGIPTEVWEVPFYMQEGTRGFGICRVLRFFTCLRRVQCGCERAPNGVFFKPF